jgi:hypothetical protein
MVLLPKVTSGGFRGISLLEVAWKVLESVLINQRIQGSVQFHNCLHGSRAQRGTGTAIIEAKLIQQLAMRRQVPVYTIFLDLQNKAYDAIDRGQTLEILEQGYGVGPSARRLLKYFWDHQQEGVVARQSGYYREAFGATRGVTQGSVLSPTIFNIVADGAVVRHWLSRVMQDTPDVPVSGFGTDVQDRFALFYVDDGAVGSADLEWLLQASFDVLADCFRRVVGLRTNSTKTKVMNDLYPWVHSDTHQPGGVLAPNGGCGIFLLGKTTTAGCLSRVQ